MKRKLLFYPEKDFRIQNSCLLILRQSVLLVVFGLFFNGTAALYAQEVKITGKVTDAGTGESLPAANVVIQGSTVGTVTDVDGNYSIVVPNQDAILAYSYIGYAEETRPVRGQTVINVALTPTFNDLNEVVVIGYGTQSKALTTGAISQVNGDDLSKRNTTQAFQALQGQTSGVQITPTSGQPGEGVKITIRGLGTIGSANPLYVVDGIQTGDITYLNNTDIESIDILKDAASAAIYGAQAANGVVLITTKTGKMNQSEITFDTYYGLSSVARKIDLLNATEYAVIMNEAAINSGKLPYFTQAHINSLGEGTDWMDEMFYDNAVTQNYSLGVSRGNDMSVYSLSASYTGEDGIVGGPDVSHYDRYNFRLNSQHKLYKFLTLGENLTYSYSLSNGIGVGNQYNNTLRGAFGTSPLLPMYDDSGNYLNNTAGANVMHYQKVWVPWNPSENNPYANMMLNNQSRDNNQKLFGNLFAEIRPFKGLTFKSTFGVDFYTGEGRSYQPIYELSMYAYRDHNNASQSLNKGLALTWDNVLTYLFNIGDHSFSALAGMSAYKNNGTSLYIRNSDLIISDLEHAWIDNATNTDLARLSFNGGPNDESKLLSYFGRLSYNFKEKYLLNATFRADGSSRFAEGNRWGYFPSVSIGWVLTNELFMDGTENWLDFFKPRFSWGRVGNQNVTPWQYLAPIDVGTTISYYFGSANFDASGNTVGAYPNRLSNENLKWETSEQMNAGFDAYILNYRLGINFDWYNKTTKDWIIQAPVLATAGAEAPYINGGDVKNTGIELALSWKDQVGAFNYFLRGNVSKNKNIVTNVPTQDGIIVGLTNMLYNNSEAYYRRAETDYPIGYFWGWQTDGVFQNEPEVASYKNPSGVIIQPNAKPGDLRYVDQDKNGVIDSDDKVMIGDPNPDYIFGFALGCDYKGFDLSVSAHGVAGNQIVQSYRNFTDFLQNYTSEILGRWHGEGTSTTIPRVTETNINYLPSDIFVKDGDFLRIDNVSLGYDFGKMIHQKWLKQARLYGSVLNVMTFTKYNGMDPEIGYGVEDGSSGTDLGYYPRPRTFLVGLNVKF